MLHAVPPGTNVWWSSADVREEDVGWIFTLHNPLDLYVPYTMLYYQVQYGIQYSMIVIRLDYGTTVLLTVDPPKRLTLACLLACVACLLG